MREAILITGGAGFIGSPPADELRKAGYEPQIYRADGLAELARWRSGPIVIDRVDPATAELERRGPIL